eukprot:CAMPEP_0172540112 /NCGR_PEP_ID=MMETSP1067-20121228/11183_1 /TAXON_ID=265564 ORGANISM="Thalassiosira punctigera, Strain Tpunct2005C2" /NCGR_SAMPLE_ID=MMETSP1067 /ASSEMBLY_ACC=CAM_ASM_000444 /LENGTH=330 /DNA_ID=CAMNT_0013325897 /DNA_START=16 /DNA_END=1008 /DNA_ORIENTATION=-
MTMTMNNRQHVTSRKPKLTPENIATILIDSSEAKGGGRKYHKGHSGNKFRNSVHRAILLSFVVFACFLLCRMILLVDLSILGGVFMVGMESPNKGRRRGFSREPIQYLSADEVRALNSIQFPDGWEQYSYNDIRRHFHCRSRSKDDAKPLPSAEEWELMRKTFTEVVDSAKEWDDPVPPTLGYSLEKGVPVPPPYFPRASPGKGRGLFASRYIRKGEIVHDGTHSDVVFPDAVAWRRFVFSLPRDLACDCTDWHWMQRLEEGGKYFMLGGINISSLMNSGGKEFGPGREPNALPESSTSGRFYATKDINKFEEILTDYESYYTNWKEVGL